MPSLERYWLKPDRQGPYALFLAIVNTYLHPESYRLEDLQARAQQTQFAEWAKFKSDFGEIMEDPAALPQDALFAAAGYEDGTDEAFLARVWGELYGDESPSAQPVTEPPSAS